MGDRIVLVVDDTATILKLTKDILEIAGFAVVTANDGDIALSILHERKIDLVVTDILMPNTDGYMLCYTIRTTDSLKNLPVIIYSATYTSLSDEEMAMEIGADKFLRKPASMDDLTKAVTSLLSDGWTYERKIPAKPKSLEATRLYNEGLVNKLERRNIDLEDIKEKLELGEARLKEAQAIAHIGNWELNLINNAGSWSDELYTLYATDKETSTPTLDSFLSFMHPDDLEFAKKQVEEAFASLSNSSFNYRFRRRDGTIRFGYSEWKFQFDQKGNPIRLYGITQDITEKKEAEEQREFDRNNLYSLINNTGDAMWSIDTDLRLVTSNHAFDEMVKAMSGSISERGSSVLNATINKGQLARFKNYYKRALSGEVFTEIEHSQVPFEFWSEISFNPIRKDGLVVGTACFSRDITERKKAETELTKKEERFRTLLQRMSDAFVSIDNNLCYTYVNEKAGEIIGNDPQWLIGKKVEEVFPDGAATPIYIGLKKAITTQEHTTISTYTERLNLWHEIHFYPSLDGVSLFVRDISENKKAEMKLIESEQRFRALIEHSAEGIALTDENSNIIYRSPGVQKITGGIPEERKKNTIGYAHPDDLEMMKSKFKEALLNPGQPVPFQGRFLHVLGHYYWMEGTLTNLLHVKGVNAVVTNFRDITERKKSEQLSLESNERYEMVSKATSDAIWDWDIGSDSTTWNHGLQKLFGYEPKQIADSSTWWEDKIHPDDHDRVWAEIEKAFHGQQESWVSSYRYKGSTGNYRHVFDRARIIYKNGKPVRMIGAMQDVDEQVKTLEEVKRLSIVASKTDNSVLILDKDVRIEWANESFTKLSGYTLAEAVGQKPFDLLHGAETDLGERKRVIEKTLLLKPFTDEILNYAKNGRKYWVRITVTPVFNEQGELDKFVTIQSDITDKKEFERSLTTIARELTGFIENANATIFGVDRNGYINEWNKVTAELSGFKKNEVLGKRWVDLFEPEIKADLSRVLARIFEGGSIDNYELPIINKKGESLILSISISPRLDVNKNIAGAICVGQDVTEISQYRQNLERMVEDRTRDLNEALKKEKELVEMKSKFVSIASHEFRTPLATIQFAVESMRNYSDKLSQDEIQKKLIKIQDQAIHMNNLLEDILTIGKSEARKIKVILSEIDLKEFIETLVEEVTATQKERRVIAFTFTSAVTKVKMDDKLLRNIIINLLTNAIKFSEASSTVKISITDLNASILIEVSDQGVGIKEEEFSSIFESFQRGSNVSTVQGTGLGLSIVKKAVELMGGSIHLESVLHKGSKFVVKLPVQ